MKLTAAIVEPVTYILTSTEIVKYRADAIGHERRHQHKAKGPVGVECRCCEPRRENDLDCIVGALKKPQRVLGDFNDAEVPETRLLDCGQALGAAGAPPGALLALGRLAEQSCQRRERLRGEVVETLERLRARELRRACRRAFKISKSEEQ